MLHFQLLLKIRKIHCYLWVQATMASDMINYVAKLIDGKLLIRDSLLRSVSILTIFRQCMLFHLFIFIILVHFTKTSILIILARVWCEHNGLSFLAIKNIVLGFSSSQEILSVDEPLACIITLDAFLVWVKYNLWAAMF